VDSASVKYSITTQTHAHTHSVKVNRKVLGRQSEHGDSYFHNNSGKFRSISDFFFTATFRNKLQRKLE